MDTPMDRSQVVQATTSQQAAVEVAKWWWAWLVAGIFWIAASMVILQFRHASITLVGVIFGIMFLLAGIQEIIVATVSGGWKWLWYSFGALFIVGGVYALFNPTKTFVAVADTLGFLFALVGIFWIVEAFATRTTNPLWILGLIAGFLMLGLGFWAEGQFLPTKVYSLLVIAGVWALLHGIGDIIKAFAIRQIGTMVAS